MRRILAIDPGTDRSAWVLVDELPGRPIVAAFGLPLNAELLPMLRAGYATKTDVDLVVIEQVEGFGMAVGKEVFETVRWAGRLEEALHPLRVEPLTRRKVKTAICHDTKAKDANIRAALIERWGGADAIRKGGPLFGISKDVWSALAIAVTWIDTEGR